MKIKLNEKEYELRYSFRMMMIYEQIAGKTLDWQNLTTQDLVILFYATVIATLQYNKNSTPLKYDDFLNWIDDNGSDMLLVEFANWYAETVTHQAELVNPEIFKEGKKLTKAEKELEDKAKEDAKNV